MPVYGPSRKRACEGRYVKTMSIAEFAQDLSARSGRRVSEDAVRRLHRKGVIAPKRDPWNRRLFDEADTEAAMRHLTGGHAAA